jgi:class 3 adenylate cyclase
MFVDLVGSTTLSARLDPEDLRELIAAYHQVVADAVKAHGGHVAQYLGDGALVYFGYPVNHEDDEEGAIKAGLALLDRTRNLTIHGAEINVRIGIATGLVVVGDKATGSDAVHEPRIMGETPNIAARLQGMARPGDIVIAESTRKLVGSLFKYESLGSVELKGVPLPVSAWKVLGATGVDDRFRALRSATTPFIGREEEVDLLSRRWRQAAEEGGKAILICGEPGVGKSRLMAAARDQLQVSDDQIVTYFCSQGFTSTALFPVVRQITRTCASTSEDTPGARRQKLQAFLGPLANPEALALVIDLLSADASGELDAIAHLSPAQRRKATFDLLIRHSEMLSADRPVAVVFEDIHWADPSTLELLDLLIARIEAHRILVIATFRPEFQPTWAGLAHVTLLTLSRLPAIQQRRLIEAVAGSAGLLSPELVAEIAERTDGVPLFLEELTKAAIEANSAGTVVARAGGKGSGIPATLHASLMARLDRLGPPARQLAQTAATIGREFTRELLGSIWPRPEGEIEIALNQLCSAGLVFVRGTGPDADYVFKHALIQDAAYGTLLREQRKELHRRIVIAFEQKFPDGMSQPALLAHHCAEAGLIAQAISHSLQAGRQSLSRSAMPEAVAQLRKAAELLSRLPDDSERWNLELSLQIALIPGLGATRGYSSAEVGDTMVRARTLAERTGSHEHLLRLLLGEWAFHLYRAEHRLALSFSERVERLGLDRNDKAAQLHGRRTTGFSRFVLGDLVTARSLLEECSELSDPIYRTVGLSQDPYALSLAHLALTYAHLGYLERSLSHSSRRCRKREGSSTPKRSLKSCCPRRGSKDYSAADRRWRRTPKSFL